MSSTQKNSDTTRCTLLIQHAVPYWYNALYRTDTDACTTHCTVLIPIHVQHAVPYWYWCMYNTLYRLIQHAVPYHNSIHNRLSEDEPSGLNV